MRIPMLARAQGGVRLALNYLAFAISGALVGPFAIRGRQFDAILVYLPSPITAALPALLIGKLRRRPVALWVFDLWPDALRSAGAISSPAVLSVVGWLVRFIHRGGDLLLGQSHSYVDRLRSEAGGRVAVEYMPVWADPPDASAADRLAPEIEHRPDLFNIVLTGNLGAAQDLPSLLAAVEALRDEPVRWILVGDGRKAQWARDEISRRGLGDIVLMPGRFPPARMASFYAHADALLVTLGRDPGLAQTIPARVQSYLAAGKPIIAMLDGDGAGVVEQSGAGYAAPPGEPANLATAIRRMMALSPAERLAMGERGLAYSKSEFDRATLMTKLEDLLQAMADRRLPRQ